MAVCGGFVALAALPAGLAALAFLRRTGAPLFPKPRRWLVPWTGFELLLLFPFASVGSMALVNPLLVDFGFYRAVYGADALAEAWEPMQPLWSAIFFTPLLLIVLLIVRHTAYKEWKPGGDSHGRGVAAARRIALGVGGWLVIHPPVWIVNFVVTAIFLALAWVAEEHPLAKAFQGGRPAFDGVVLFVQAAIATPIVEELLFRGAILPWIYARRYRSGIVMAIAVAFANVSAYGRSAEDFSLALGPGLFSLALLAGWLLVQFRLHRKRRAIDAVYSSAALFAVVHTSVWPTPIPLFLLGLGLGWLAVRTRGYAAPAIVHGLFNAVSVLFVLGA